MDGTCGWWKHEDGGMTRCIIDGQISLDKKATPC